MIRLVLTLVAIASLASCGSAPGSDSPGIDADLDGYEASEDCNDADASVFPGVSTSCTAECGEGTQTCQADGSVSPCVCTPLCEATTGRCYYISQSRGSDANPGSFTAPWASYLNIVSYYAPDDHPATAVDLQPGDFVYFFDGTYTETYGYFNQEPALFLRQVNGADGEPITLKAYPGQTPILSPARTQAINIAQSSWIDVEGFEIRDVVGGGVRVEESDHVGLSRLNIHDIRGNSASNIAGLSIQSSDDVTLDHSEIHDIIPSEDIEGDNLHVSHCVILFRGGNNRILYNTLWQGPAPDERMRLGGVLYKHAAETPGQHFEVAYNTIRDVHYSSVSSGSPGSRIHHNLIVDSSPIRFTNFGGPTNNSDNIVSHNTILGGALSYAPSNEYFPVGAFDFTDNIVVDSAESYGEFGVVVVSKYGSDALYSEVVTAGTLTFERNCYFNPQAPLRWDLFDASGGDYGVLGQAYDFAGWQALGFDTSSTVVDPVLDADSRPTEEACAERGWLAGR
ncbi:MAG: right-handed parallel beta-helix repeat-containing protein [Deltaproteobacteria bacterium]|nr:right-handed parallel beta-helix repeat-containing protein [Deltaproteobacteria bacterium]